MNIQDLPFFLITILFFMCTDVLSASISVHPLCALCLQRPEEDIPYPGTGAIDCWEPTHVTGLRTEPWSSERTASALNH
jgi:hypothetical protein